MSALLSLLRRDLMLARQQGGDTVLAVVFFILVVVIVPLAVGPEAEALRLLAAPVCWVALLLAMLLSLDRVVAADWADGTLDQLVLADTPLALVALMRSLAHWLSTALPLMMAAPLVAVLYGMAPEDLGYLILAVAVGSPALSLLGVLGASLVLGARHGGLLLVLLVLPLAVPVLIFGVAAAAGTAGALKFLAGIGLLSVVLCPVAAGVALRAAVDG